MTYSPEADWDAYNRYLDRVDPVREDDEELVYDGRPAMPDRDPSVAEGGADWATCCTNDESCEAGTALAHYVTCPHMLDVYWAMYPPILRSADA